MTKYKFILYFPGGGTFDSYVEEGRYFDSEDDAADAALDYIGAYNVGRETLHLSNPGDYDYDGDDNLDYDIEEIEL